MRTLQSQVKLRRLIRSTSEAITRLRWEPSQRVMAGSIVDRLLELAAEVRESWAQEALAGRPGEPLSAGVAQDGSDLELLRQDFDRAALPLEAFLRGLDAEPALQRSA